jgi:antitoxin MazE
MIVTRIGDSLAVALPADEVDRLGLKEGDEVMVEVRRAVKAEPAEDVRKLSPEEWLKRMERFSGMLPDDFKFDRDEANER